MADIAAAITPIQAISTTVPLSATTTRTRATLTDLPSAAANAGADIRSRPMKPADSASDQVVSKVEIEMIAASRTTSGVPTVSAA